MATESFTIQRCGAMKKRSMQSNSIVTEKMNTDDLTDQGKGHGSICSETSSKEDEVQLRKTTETSDPDSRRLGRLLDDCDINWSTIDMKDYNTNDTRQRYNEDDTADDDDCVNEDKGIDFDEGFSEDEVIYENQAEYVKDEQDMEKKRMDVVKEVMRSEQTYLEKLLYLRKVKRQLEAINSLKHFLPPGDINMMFPYIEELSELHSSLKKALEGIPSKWNPKSTLANVLVQKLADFSVYSNFINCFPRSVKTLEMWRAKDEQFAKLLTLFQHSSVCLLSLLDVMHEPYTRLQKMKLLLRRYKTFLIHTEKESGDIERVINMIEGILSECEGILKTANELETLLQLSNRIEDILGHLSINTRLLKEGSVIELDPRGNHVKKRAFNQLETPLHLMLFNEFLLICTPIEANKKQRICSKIKLSAVKLASPDSLALTRYNIDSIFILQTPSKARILVSAWNVTQMKCSLPPTA